MQYDLSSSTSVIMGSPGSEQVNVTISNVKGNKEPISFSFPDLPDGITANVTAEPSKEPFAYIVTFTAAAGLPRGTHHVTIKTNTPSGFSREQIIDLMVLPSCTQVVTGSYTGTNDCSSTTNIAQVQAGESPNKVLITINESQFSAYLDCTDKSIGIPMTSVGDGANRFIYSAKGTFDEEQIIITFTYEAPTKNACTFHLTKK